MKKRIRLLLPVLIVCIFAYALVAQTQTTVSADNSTDNSCQTILTRAYSTLQNVCTSLERNKACYANNNVKSDLAANASGTFSTPGDKLPLAMIKTLTTSPLNLDNATWGLSLLKVQANLPDTLPGQNVTFLVYGDTSVQNASTDMRSFYFTSGLGTPSCKQAPASGIIVRSPNHMQVSFLANGVNITIASTIIMRAQSHQSMSVQLIEGSAVVQTRQGYRSLKPGEMTTVKLGGNDGLDGVGLPSNPTTPPVDPAIVSIIDAANKTIDPTSAATFTVDGYVTKVVGNIITVYGYTVKLDGNTDAAKTVRVGDYVHVAGFLSADDTGVFVSNVDLSLAPRRTSSSSAGGNNNGGNNNNNSNNSNGGGQTSKIDTSTGENTHNPFNKGDEGGMGKPADMGGGGMGG